MTEQDSKYRAPALDRGLDILELLAGVEGGLMQADIARDLGRSPNEFYRMLDRLVRRGYVVRGEDGRYALSLKMFSMAQYHRPTRRLASLALPFMRDLAANTLQANQLVVFDRGHPVVIAQQEAPGYWGISIRVGSRIGLLDTGSGHILLAFADDVSRERMLREHNDVSDEKKTIPRSLAGRFEEIRSKGFEMMPSLQTAGVENLSAPVIGPDGQAVAALTIPYLPFHETQMVMSKEEAVGQLTLAARGIADGAGLSKFE